MILVFCFCWVYKWGGGITIDSRPRCEIGTGFKPGCSIFSIVYLLLNVYMAKAKLKKESIRAFLLIPLSLTIVILLGTFVIALNQMHNRYVNAEVRKSVDEVSQLFQTELEEDAGLLEIIIGFLEKDKNLQDAWLAGDRESLLGYALPIFEDVHSKHEDIRSQHDVTHFYFHGLDRVNFLRVHKPQRHGDYIDRFTMNQAVSSGKDAWGIELGPLGTFTLRYVYPWVIDGKLSGYIELGEEIGHITPELAEITGAELFFVINKSYLNRGDWEDSLKMLGQTGNWDRYSDVVVIDSTMEDVPSAIGTEMQRHLVDHEDFLFKAKGAQNYFGGFVPLYDAGGTKVGDIVVLKDISTLQASLRGLLISVTGICSTVSIFLLVLFYLYAGRIGQQLEETRNGLLTEIEEHKQSKKKIQNQKEFLDSVLRSLTYPLYVINANDYTVKLANPEANADELPENTTCYGLYHKRDKPCEGIDEPCPLSEVKKTKKPVVVEHIHYDKGGKPQNVEVHCFPILDDNGNVSEVIEYSLDITKRKQAEAEREKLIKLLESKNREMKNIVYTASHDLRSPLVNIGGFSSELKTDCDQLLGLLAEYGGAKGEQIELLLKQYIPESLDFITASAEKMSGLLDGLLQVSRVGAAQVNSESLDMDKIVREVLAATEYQIKEKGIAVTVDSLVGCIGDRNMLDRVFANLIGNAIKYSDPAKKGEIRISSEVEDGMSIYCVEDNGIGIALENQEKVFEIFHRINPDDAGGSEGLGLTIVTRILDRVGGKIRLESEPGKGSRFFVSLPTVKA